MRRRSVICPDGPGPLQTSEGQERRRAGKKAGFNSAWRQRRRGIDGQNKTIDRMQNRDGRWQEGIRLRAAPVLLPTLVNRLSKTLIVMPINQQKRNGPLPEGFGFFRLPPMGDARCPGQCQPDKQKRQLAEICHQSFGFLPSVAAAGQDRSGSLLMSVLSLLSIFHILKQSFRRLCDR